MDPNVFETANAGFAQAMYEEFLKDPATVGPDWRRLFESGIVGERPGIGGNGANAVESLTGTPVAVKEPAATITVLSLAMPSSSGLVRLNVWSWCSSTTGTRYFSNSGTQCLRLAVAGAGLRPCRSRPSTLRYDG